MFLALKTITQEIVRTFMGIMWNWF